MSDPPSFDHTVLLDYMSEHELSVRKLAVQTGINRTTLARVAAGQEVPSSDVLRKLEPYLAVETEPAEPVEVGTMSTQQAAVYLGVSETTIRRWAASGLLRGKYYGPSRRMRFTRTELESFVASQPSTSA